MSGVHKHPTISFRVSDYERREIDAKIKASGMLKKDYFVRSCIYNRVCVVGKKETIYPGGGTPADAGTDEMSGGAVRHERRGDIIRGGACRNADGLSEHTESGHLDAGRCKVSVGRK